MYLYKREYVSGWNFREDSDTSLYDMIIEKMGIERCEGSPHANIDVCIAYWRKANAIHKWFCALDGGRDECQPIYVTRDQLVELRDLAWHASTSPAMAASVLPPQPGFFFGSYEIDDWYMEDMKNTIRQLDAAIEATADDQWATFIYQASW